MTTDNKGLRADEVAEYLAKNQQFFHIFPGLLDELSIPHPESGKAVSLLERQVWQLRQQKQLLQDQVDSLVSIAGDNGVIMQKLHHLALRLLQAPTQQAALDALYQQLQGPFAVEQVTLFSWELPNTSLAGLQQLGVRQDWVASLKASLTPGQPVCGFIEAQWKQGLFKTTEPIESMCCVPLGWQSVWGVLALGSHSNRFQPDLGTYFLKILGELVSSQFNNLFNDALPAEPELTLSQS